jgi:hypothetical protein
MSFSATDINFQERYKLTGLKNGVDAGDSVAMRQLTPVLNDVQTLFAGLQSSLRSNDFGPLFNQYRTQLALQDGNQVEAAIAAALAGMPDPEQRLASVAVHSVFVGPLADLTASIASFGLTSSDNGIDDSNISCVLLDSPVATETGLYQMRSNGSLMKINGELFSTNIGYYTRFYVINGSQPGREFAVTGLDVQASGLEVTEIPYNDQYVGLGPIQVSGVNKTINFNFSAADFVLAADGFGLHPAMKAAIALIPGLSDSVEALTDLINGLNTTLSNQINALTGQVTALTQTVASQATNLSSMQTQLQGLAQKLANSFANIQEIFFAAGVPQIRSGNSWGPAPSSFVEELSGDASVGIYRIYHNRGLATMPVYLEANNQGEPQAACFAFKLQAMTENYVQLTVEKYKPVLILFEAGLKASAFSA